MHAGVQPSNHDIEKLRSQKVKIHWLILNSDTSNARRSAAIQSCPWETKIAESEKPLAYPQQRYIECTPECSHSIIPMRSYKNIDIAQQQKTKEWNIFRLCHQYINEMVTSYLHRSIESMFMTENDFFASFLFSVTYDVRTVKKKFCEKIYRRKRTVIRRTFYVFVSRIAFPNTTALNHVCLRLPFWLFRPEDF